MAPAAKIVFASFVLVNGVTENAQKIINNKFEGVWTFVQSELNFKLFQKMIALQTPHEGAVKAVEKILEADDVRDFQSTAVVEIVHDWVQKMIKK